MRTLITLVLLCFTLCLSAESLLVDKETVVEFIQNPDGTWKKVEVINEINITQPKDVRFTEVEILQRLAKGETVTISDTSAWTETTSSFSVSKYPFFTDTYRVTNKNYTMQENEIGEVVMSYTYTNNNPVAIWMILFSVLLSVSLAFRVSHKSYTSLFLVGLSLIVGIALSYFFGWLGFLAAAALSIGVSIWSAEECYGNDYEPGLAGFVAGIFRTLVCCGLVAADWDDGTGKGLFATIFGLFIIGVWGLAVLWRKHTDGGRIREGKIVAT